MEVKPLGDQAVLVYLPDEASAVALAAAVRAAAPPWLHDVVPAYASVGVFFDADAIKICEVVEWLKASRAGHDTGEPQHTRVHTRGSPRAHTIPVCYEMQLDAARVCEHAGLSFDDVIRLHTATTFAVYAVGFVPGFPYMGYLPAELCGVGRLPSPRTRVEPGSVGVTGRQTAIYPAPSPGGWALIGRTPLTIVDVADGFFPLRVGDAVRFERIDARRFAELSGERLDSRVI
jgi:inhibitor of KinA